ncbi:4-hydroxythreonine-4-phosphate dehydrogenase PdxA [Candidatus Dependentiae bacterium]|nr:4-hydroxythreonine-4-phosphate dehydrogenase PdxA [Candidatus Dependentiae bacterium]
MHRIGVTIGDINGVGPEIFLTAFQKEKKLFSNNRIILIGSKVAIEFYRKRMRYNNKPVKIKFQNYNESNEVSGNTLEIVNIKNTSYIPEPGKISKDAGRIAYSSILKACEMIKDKTIDAIVTLPINKVNLRKANCKFTGHTTILENEFKKRISMCFLSKQMNILLTTIHIPLSEVHIAINKNLIIEKVSAVDAFFKIRGIENIFLILGLNPHAGEENIFGEEETQEIIPAVKSLKKLGVNISGPVPPDSAFTEMNRKEFDFFVCMYHDQGLIPLKSHAFFESCQLSVGLDFVRTSVSHGTAFDIAGEGIANPSSFIFALKKTCRLLK